MNIQIPLIVLTASVVAIALACSALPRQRSWRRLFRPFPVRATAILAALVALKGWVDMLGIARGVLTSISTLGMPRVAVHRRRRTAVPLPIQTQTFAGAFLSTFVSVPPAGLPDSWSWVSPCQRTGA